MRVAWDTYLEGRLLEVVERAEKMLPRYTKAGKSKAGWWDAVAGMFYTETGTATTGDAVRKRWAKVRDDLEADKQADVGYTWESVAALVEQYEADIHDATYEQVTGLHKDMQAVKAALADVYDRSYSIERMVKLLCDELGMSPSPEGDKV